MAAGWRLAVASATGTSHARTGTPCQDSVRHAIVDSVDGPALVVVVSDGAGSAAFSEVGSRIAVDTFVEEATRHLEMGGTIAQIDRALAQCWLLRVRASVEAAASTAGESPRDFACTLVAAVVGERHHACVQVGDGAIVFRPGDEAGWAYVFWPQHGEFANTTNFVVASDVTDLMAFDSAERRIDELAVFSDGIEKLVLHEATKTVHEPFFDAVFPPVRACDESGADPRLCDRLKAYLESARICERTDDDKTLVIATRRAKAAMTDVRE